MSFSRWRTLIKTLVTPEQEIPAQRCVEAFFSCLTEEHFEHGNSEVHKESASVSYVSRAEDIRSNSHHRTQLEFIQDTVPSISIVPPATLNQKGFDSAPINVDDDDEQAGTSSGPTVGRVPVIPRKRRTSCGSVITLSDDDEQTGPNIVRGPQKRRVGRPSASPDGPVAQASPFSKPWGAIMEIEALELDPTLQKHMEHNTTHDASLFLKNRQIPRTAPTPDPQGFPEFCVAVNKMPHKKIMDYVCRLFLIATVADIAHKLGLTKRKAAIISTYNAAIYDSIFPIIEAGKGLAFLCNQFGNGCIFLLSRELTDSFLQNRVTKSGFYYEEAMKHVKKLGLLQSIQRSSANQLGDAIRTHLRRAYQVERIGTDLAEIADEDDSKRRPEEGEGGQGSGAEDSGMQQ
ncbi:MAG: hypothetical protein Q9208_007289 [Pyrenodesmia sp. 3 TL-2023]